MAFIRARFAPLRLLAEVRRRMPHLGHNRGEISHLMICRKRINGQAVKQYKAAGGEGNRIRRRWGGGASTRQEVQDEHRRLTPDK
ncbi:unnamed protein product [Ceratitis capitata]|uniref:(Mediterranean fruit fly) hypothetical protein n=1 Tax=Ceratitis capitata TaxID=7213 RepID=A0A811VDY1_CERCA|nr:unnamed protein product [Ceratitis capitata]